MEHTPTVDILSTDELRKYISPKYASPSVEVFDEITSTNTVMKERAVCGALHGSIIAASQQSCGRGRLGRSFFSPSASGIYMSILLRPSISPADAPLITTAAAVAVCEAIESLCDAHPQIKWVNDIFINDKKVCGILTESSLSSSGCLDFVVLGIGINVYPPAGGFPEDISSIAGSVFTAVSPSLKNRLAASVYNAFMEHYSSLTEKNYVDSYRRRCMVIGKKINVISNGISTPAHALSLDDDCRLLVRYDDGNESLLSSGEISIRF